ncbi:hypothetical protein DET57_10333 [Klebsiella oxytoca]|uniref:Uncharacterized protein n=1 Tax=Klebsiella oxytoca TaxID=571 RepID=A0A318FW11_KLEOX|nr:hypothetical protein DET57_10333 [Klebsiella oxytoca]
MSRCAAQKLALPGEKSRELAFHQKLISYIDNRYLEKVYQQFLDGYIAYVILYLKEDNQESAQILSALMFSNMWNGPSMGHKVTEEKYASISIREHKGLLQAPYLFTVKLITISNCFYKILIKISSLILS